MATLKPEQVGQIFCFSRLGNDEAAVEGILSPALKSAIADAWSKDDAWEKANPGDKPPLGDGIPWQAWPDYAAECSVGLVTLMKTDARVEIHYGFPESADANFTDTLLLKRIDMADYGTAFWRIDNIAYATGGDLQATLRGPSRVSKPAALLQLTRQRAGRRKGPRLPCGRQQRNRINEPRQSKSIFDLAGALTPMGLAAGFSRCAQEGAPICCVHISARTIAWCQPTSIPPPNAPTSRPKRRRFGTISPTRPRPRTISSNPASVSISRPAPRWTTSSRRRASTMRTAPSS